MNYIVTFEYKEPSLGMVTMESLVNARDVLEAIKVAKTRFSRVPVIKDIKVEETAIKPVGWGKLL